MTLQLSLNAAGGLALFLLAMLMMTDGLKIFAGGALKRLLDQWTSTALRGVVSGMIVTGIVQSSSAVTVATIGFVNAGVLTQRQALGVIFGTNVGTTMTGWLVAVVGFGIKIESLALPILAVGVGLRLMAPGKRYEGLGQALAGFGLFFLGLAFLKEAFAGLAVSYGASLAGGGSRVMFVIAGFVATVLTQSSSAAIAIILTAAAGGMVGIEPAAAAIIGANIGTTSTAALAVLKATPSARRLALGHIAFNLVTGIVALVLLPVLLWLVHWLAFQLGSERQPAVQLALFHTVFNVLGVAIRLPLANRMAAFLERCFRTAEEDMGRPQHLDATLVSTPELAIAALWQELLRLRRLVIGIVQAAFTSEATTALIVEHRSAALRTLSGSIAGFIARLRTETMPLEVGNELARALRIGRYLHEAARLAPGAHALRLKTNLVAESQVLAALERTLVDACACVALANRPEITPENDAARSSALEEFQQAYQGAKAAALEAAVGGRFCVDETERLLDDLSITRRLVEQLVKADRLLRTPELARAIEEEPDESKPEPTRTGQSNGPGSQIES